MNIENQRKEYMKSLMHSDGELTNKVANFIFDTTGENPSVIKRRMKRAAFNVESKRGTAIQLSRGIVIGKPWELSPISELNYAPNASFEQITQILQCVFSSSSSVIISHLHNVGYSTPTAEQLFWDLGQAFIYKLTFESLVNEQEDFLWVEDDGHYKGLSQMGKIACQEVVRLVHHNNFAGDLALSMRFDGMAYLKNYNNGFVDCSLEYYIQGAFLYFAEEYLSFIKNVYSPGHACFLETMNLFYECPLLTDDLFHYRSHFKGTYLRYVFGEKGLTDIIDNIVQGDGTEVERVLEQSDSVLYLFMRQLTLVLGNPLFEVDPI